MVYSNTRRSVFWHIFVAVSLTTRPLYYWLPTCNGLWKTISLAAKGSVMHSPHWVRMRYADDECLHSLSGQRTSTLVHYGARDEDGYLWEALIHQHLNSKKGSLQKKS